jgi:hypothetical protein
VENRIRIFKTFEEQERYFLQYFFQLTPSERLQSLAALQKKNYPNFLKPSGRLLTVHKQYFANGR